MKMKTPILSFKGQFQVWTFDVSHGRLLIRRMKEEPDQSRVDVVFENVRIMQIHTTFDSLTIYEFDSGDITNETAFRETIRVVAEPGLRWFQIISNNFKGYVCASALSSHEDGADFGDPSGIYEPGPLLVRLAVESSWYKERYGRARQIKAEHKKTIE